MLLLMWTVMFCWVMFLISPTLTHSLYQQKTIPTIPTKVSFLLKFCCHDWLNLVIYWMKWPFQTAVWITVRLVIVNWKTKTICTFLVLQWWQRLVRFHFVSDSKKSLESSGRNSSLYSLWFHPSSWICHHHLCQYSNIVKHNTHWLVSLQSAEICFFCCSLVWSLRVYWDSVVPQSSWWEMDSDTAWSKTCLLNSWMSAQPSHPSRVSTDNGMIFFRAISFTKEHSSLHEECLE